MMLLNIFTGICTYDIAIIVAMGLLFLLFVLKLKRRDKKIETLNSEIKKKKLRLKFKSYHQFFKIVRQLYTHLKPETISIYLYNKKEELNITMMKFIYQIKADGEDGTISFTGNYDNIPITNIDVITKCYYNKDIMSLNINDLNHYDNGLYEYFKNKDITELYLLNIFCQKCENSKPIGFFALTYKDRNLTEEEKNILLEGSIKISDPFKDILYND